MSRCSAGKEQQTLSVRKVFSKDAHYFRVYSLLIMHLYWNSLAATPWEKEFLHQGRVRSLEVLGSQRAISCF